MPACGGPGPLLARRVTRSPRRHAVSQWSKSHPKSAKAHFTRAPQSMLPRRCWNKPHSRKAASPVDSTSRFTICTRAGHQLRPATSRPVQPPPHPLQPSPPKRAKGFEPSTFSLGNAGPRLCLCEKVPCGAPIRVEHSEGCLVCLSCFVQSVYKCVQTYTT